jgi:regulator of protease activity HflC (stomatin/prohibitin superfamily)
MLENTNNKGIMSTRKIYVALCGVFIFTLIWDSFHTVNEGHVGIVKRFGKAQAQVDPGLHFKIPFVDSIVSLEIRTRKNSETLRASTHEQMPVEAVTSVNWTVNKVEALSLYIKYGGLDQFENRILDPKLRSATKAAISKYKAEEIIQNRGKVVSQIELSLSNVMVKFPVKLDSVQLENVKLPQKYLDSIETKQREKNLADAEKHKLDRQKLEAQREVNTAEAERDALKARADGKAYATFQQSKADAKSIQLKGEAEAKAILAKQKALQKSRIIVDYTKAQQWDGKLPSTVLGDSNILWNFKKD